MRLYTVRVELNSALCVATAVFGAATWERRVIHLQEQKEAVKYLQQKLSFEFSSNERELYQLYLLVKFQLPAGTFR